MSLLHVKTITALQSVNRFLNIIYSRNQRVKAVSPDLPAWESIGIQVLNGERTTDRRKHGEETVKKCGGGGNRNKYVRPGRNTEVEVPCNRQAQYVCE